MYQKERLDTILNYIRENGYVTTKNLVEKFHYSVASVNRDLNILQTSGLVKRSYGGVEFIEKKYTPYTFRQHKEKNLKSSVSKKAVELISDGDTVFISGSTTTEYMLNYLTTKKNITVITNNMYLASQLSMVGVKTVCLGGKVTVPPFFLGGSDTVNNARKYIANKFFFSTASCTLDGQIGTGWTWYDMYVEMCNNSEKTYYLVTSSKIRKKSDLKALLFDFSKVSGVISDIDFDESVKAKFPNTEFIKI